MLIGVASRGGHPRETAFQGARISAAQSAHCRGFHRTGAVEVWSRGTNRVIEICRAYGIDAPEFSEESGVVAVTFRVAALAEAGAEAPGRHQVGTRLGRSRD